VLARVGPRIVGRSRLISFDLAITPSPFCSAIPSHVSATCPANSSRCLPASPPSPGFRAFCSLSTRVTPRRKPGLQTTFISHSAFSSEPSSGSPSFPFSALRFRPGQVEGRGHRHHLCRSLCACRCRRNRQRGPAHQVGIPAQYSLYDLDAVAAPPRRPEFSQSSLPTAAIAAMFMLACILCLGMLDKRIRAREVVADE